MVAKIYTRKGDEGNTSLCGGSRTGKDALRVDAYGTVDELMSFIGLCIVKLDQDEVKDHLLIIQNDLHTVGSNLAYPGNLSQSQINGESIATKIPHVTEKMINRLE
ncbi:MAG: ATP:cob(I)alamin adenosyltransferase, partial [Candidatus Heimdallarchaeota archaeon]|nr:ATP:cob(I)alamin adenosyltransferase [Candidatus Heimdallarchaeota archaeon]